MKKLFRRMLPVMVIALAVLVSSTPINTLAAKNNGKVYYTLKNGTLTVSGKGKMPKNMTFKKNKKIKKVVIKKGVTSISDNAFNGCTNLKKVKIGNSVVSIGEKAFKDTKIEKLVIPDSTKYIKKSAFAGCVKLKNVKFGKKLKTIENAAFWVCTKLKNITIPNSVKTIGDGAFGCCNKAEKIVLGKKVEYIGEYAFTDNYKVTEIVIPDKVETIGDYAFQSCKKLNKITIGKKVNTIGTCAFSGTKINEAVIPASVKNIGNCVFDNLTNIVMPGRFDSYPKNSLTIDFCKNITFNTDVYLGVIQNLNCENYILNGTDKNYKSINGDIYTKDGKSLVRIAPAKKNVTISDGCEVVCLSAFLYNCGKDSEENVRLGKRFESIEVPKTVKKFDLYSNLTYVEDEYTYKGAYKEHTTVTRMNFEDKTIKPENLEAFLERINCADKNKAEIIAQFAK